MDQQETQQPLLESAGDVEFRRLGRPGDIPDIPNPPEKIMAKVFNELLQNVPSAVDPRQQHKKAFRAFHKSGSAAPVKSYHAVKWIHNALLLQELMWHPEARLGYVGRVCWSLRSVVCALDGKRCKNVHLKLRRSKSLQNRLPSRRTCWLLLFVLFCRILLLYMCNKST